MPKPHALDDFELQNYSYNQLTKSFFHKNKNIQPIALKEIPSLLDECKLDDDKIAQMEFRVLPSKIRYFLKLFSEHHKKYFPPVPQSWIASCLTHEARQISNVKPRFELRKDPAGHVTNIAASYINSESRSLHLKNGVFKKFDIFVSGSTTIEVGVPEIDKATVLYYLSKHLDKVFPHIEKENSGIKHPLLIADFDGTLTDEPIAGKEIPTTFLNHSPVKESLIEYLEKKGLLVISSGNAYQRVLKRFLTAFTNENKHLLSQVAIAASGGHTLFIIDPISLQPVIIPHYRKQALQEQAYYEKNYNGKSQFNRTVITIGDDGKKSGNDFAMLAKATDGICVSIKSIENEADILRKNHVPGGPKAVAAILNIINNEMDEHIKNLTPLSSIAVLAEKARAALTRADQMILTRRLQL